MTPSWYDLLDVAHDASSDEIRAAWREAVADLDPTDRRFAVLNRAAKVLLDPESRAAYDAELADAEDEPEDEPEDVEEADEPTASIAVGVPPAKPPKKAAPKKAAPKKAAPTKAPPEKAPPEKAPPEKAAPKAAPTKPASMPAKPTKPAPTAKDPGATPATARPARRPGSLVGAILAAAISLAFVVLTLIPLLLSRDEDDLAEGVAEARRSAERAIVPVLSYDATDLEAGRSSALTYMTDDFGGRYEELFDGIIQENAAETGTQVSAEFLSSGIVRADTAGERVQVLVFVDQTRTNRTSATPQAFSNQVTVTMQKVDDRWLVDDLQTNIAGG